MNRMYRLIWSESIKAFVPTAEITRRRGKRSGGGNALAGALIAGATGLAAGGAAAGEPIHSGGAIVVSTPTTLTPPPATALPTAPQVTAGAASVVANGAQLTVTESTSTAAINWNSFNIGSAAGVTFVQPGASSVILNRVLSADPSQIYGSMTSNGIVFLINPQGVLFGQGAEVNVGGLVASSLSLSDKNLLAGNWSFTAGSAAGAVSNAGSIRVTPGGFAALLGGKVENTGSIAARLGSVALASGRQITLDLDDGGLLKVGVDQAALNAMVANSGAIVADGGRIILTAKSANELLGTVVNNTGVLRAEGIGERDGQVWLLAADLLANTGANGAAANAHAVQDNAGAVASTGSIDVSGTRAGEVTLAGTEVTLAGTIDAGSAGGSSGAGGRVLLNSTQATTLAAGSVVDLASAGTGGKLVVWSDGATSALGRIDARGTGAQGGGGTVEISAGGTLGFDATVQLAAASVGQAGTLILDPATLAIAPGSGSAPDTVYQSALQTQSGNIVLAASGQITIDVLTNNVLNLANATSLNITSQNSGGITFVNGAGGLPSGITTHNAPVTLLAGGSGSLDNVGQITTNGGDINLSGVYVHLAGGLDATNGGSTPGNVALSIFGGGILSSSANPIAGGQVLLDATYGYIGSASSAVPTATSDLIVKTGGNAYVSDSSAMASLALTSNHLEGSPVGIDISAPNVVLTGSDAIGDGSLYSAAVRWTNYSASNPGSLAGPSAVTITEDGNLLPQNINLPATALTLTSSQGSILGGNAAPIVASTLTMASTLAIGGTDFSGGNAENDLGTGGNTLLTQAGSITANVITAAGNITGIVNLTQQGDLLGSVQASQVLLQASGNIGSSAAPFALNTSSSGEVYNLAAAGDLFVNAQFLNTLVFTNVQAGGDLNLAMDTPNGYLVQVNRAMAGGNLNVSGSQFSFLWVQAATATNGSIAITNEGALEVDAATLNGTGAVNRAIDLTSDASQVVFGLLSTNGPAGSAAAAMPLGNIVIDAPQGIIADLALATEGGGVSALRAANATLTASTGMGFANTEVDTHTKLVLTAGVPGGEGGEIEGNLSGIDSVSDPTGSAPHAIHLANVLSYGAVVSLSNSNGDFEVGSVRSYNDYGSDGSSPGGLSLTASGSIVADGSVGGGRINAADLTGNGGSITLTAGGNLGTRGTGSDGTTGASPLSLNGNSLALTTGGDLFANNAQGVIGLALSLNYAASTTPYFYHFTAATPAQAQGGTAGVTFNAASSDGLLDVSSATIADGAAGVFLDADGNIRVRSWQTGHSDQLTIFGQNIAIDALSGGTPALAMGDSSTLEIHANGSLSVGNLASTGTNAGDSSVDLEAYGGALTLGKVNAANANVTVYATDGDILGSTGNQLLANTLNIANTFGAIGADPTTMGSIPIKLGVAQSLTISNAGGGGSINLVTLSDPASLNLTLGIPDAPSYAGAHFLIAPATTGLGLSGSADATGVSLASLGTTGTNPAAVPLTIIADTPSITIDSGAGAQLGIGYVLQFGATYPEIAANLSGSVGQTVHIELNDNLPVPTLLTGTLALTNLQVDENLASSHPPLTVDFTLAQPLSVFTLVRDGSYSDWGSFAGNSFAMAGSGQSFQAVESFAGGNVAGAVTVNATSATPLDLTVDVETTGNIAVGTINLAGLSTVNLTANTSNLPYQLSFSGLISGIEGVDGSNSIHAANVNLSATGLDGGQATIGTAAVPLNVSGTNLALTSTGDLYLNTSGALASLAIVVSHPIRDDDQNNYPYDTTSTNYVYQITGSTTLAATDDAADTATNLSFTSASPINFSFKTDRIIDVGTIDAGTTGSVSLTANGNWNIPPYYITLPVGIEQGTGSGITAGAVSLTANGLLGHAGTSATALDVATGNLTVNVNGSINIVDTLPLTALSLTLAHGAAPGGGQPDNSYALTAPDLALSLVDQFNASPGFVALQNLVSDTLQTFSLTLTDANLTVGQFNNGTGDFTGNRIALGSSATLNLTASGAIWEQSGGGTYHLNDSTSGAVPATAAVIEVGTLNLNAGGDVIYSPQSGISLGADVSIPIEVNNLTVVSAGEVGITNVGSLNIVSATVTGSGYFRAIEAAPATPASLSGGSLGAPITAADLTLVAYYGDIGSSADPVITNTPSLGLDSGANIYAANQSQLTALSVISHHNKGSINDTSNGGLNALLVTDTGGTSGTPLQLGVTDLGVAGGGYQVTGMVAPQLAFSFQTDLGISVGSLDATTVALTSETGSILHIPGNGTITADSVSLSAYTPGASVGAPGENILVNTPSLSVSTGGNLGIADSANIASLSFTIGAVTDLGTTPVYHLDNSAAPNPLGFNVTGDTVNNVLDINSITVSRTDLPVAITVYSPGSNLGVNTISDAATTGGAVSLTSANHSIFALGGTPGGIHASTVSLLAGGDIGVDTSGTAAPLVVITDSLQAGSSGAMRLSSPDSIAAITLQENNAAPPTGSVWSVTATGFTLSGAVNGSGVLDVSAVAGTATNLEVDTETPLRIGTLSLGSGALTLSANLMSSGKTIDSDGTNGGSANISTTGNVSLTAWTGIGANAEVTTDIGGTVTLGNNSGGIAIDQISSKPLVLSAVGECNCGNSPISITALTDLSLTAGLSAGNGANSPVTLTAGGDINFLGNALSLNGGPVSLTAGGSIAGGNISLASAASLTAAGTASGSPGTITIGSIDGDVFNPASGAITLQAAGDVNIAGTMMSAVSVTITSTNGSIYGQSNDGFGSTPILSLTAAGDIGAGGSGAVGQWLLNGIFDNPGSLALYAQAGGQINLASDAAFNATHVVGGGNVALQTFGYYSDTTPVGISVGQVSSTNGSVTLVTTNGDITASGGSSAITAGTAITLDAQQNNLYFYNAYVAVGQAFNIGSAGAPMSLTAPMVNLTANGNIYATVPTTGLTDLSVARTYVSSANSVDQAAVMPAGTVLVTDPSADTVLNVTDGGWTAGNVSAISASYGTALNLSYAGVNAVQLGTVSLNGGNLNLQATSPSNISITSTGGLISANNFSFNLVDANGIDGTGGVATGGFGTLANPINTEITTLSGTTVGPTAGVFMNQIGSITFANLSTGGDIVVTTTRALGAPSANANISIGNVTSVGGSVSLTADGGILAANGVATPTVTANGPAYDGDITLQAANGVNLPAANLSSGSGSVNVGASAGGLALAGATLNAGNGDVNIAAAAGGLALLGVNVTAGGNINIGATSGDIALASSNLNASNGDITVQALAGAVDLTAAAVQSGSVSSTITVAAGQGNITIGAINTAGYVDVTATTGAILATPAQLNLTNLPNGITAGSDISLTAATGIGTAALPLSLNTLGYISSTLTANTTGTGADVYLVTGLQNPGNAAMLEASIGGSLSVASYNNLTLDNVQTAGDINVTEQNYYLQILLNNVTATAPGATFTFDAPYGNIASPTTSGSVSAARIVLNALGDSTGGTLGQNLSPVNVDGGVVIAVASGDIALNSTATDPSKMPLVASNGAGPTISITSAGDFLAGEIVAGQQGTVAISAAGNIFDDGDPTTQIYASTVSLTAVDAIGTAQAPIQLTTVAYGDSGSVLPGTISAASTTQGDIHLKQQGDAILQSLTAADGSIFVTINDAAHGQSQLVFADTSQTDAAGNDINVAVTNGDLTVDVAQAGMTAGTVNLTAVAGSIFGDGRADCCTNPNVSANSVNLSAANNIGTISDLGTLAGTAVGVEANQSAMFTSANNSQINIQYVGNATVGGMSPNVVSPQGTNAEVLLQACGNLTLAGLNLPGASLGLAAGTGGNGGSVLDGVSGGANLATPDVTAGSVTFGAANDVGAGNAPLWVNAPTIAATATSGGVWINDAATTPATLTSVTAGNGPVAITSQGNLLVDTINAGGSSATLGSVTGSVQDGIGGGSNAADPNVVAGSVTVNAALSAGSASDALWVNAPIIGGDATNGGVWINDAAATPVTVSSLIAGNGPVAIASQGNLLIGSINAGSGNASLSSVDGTVLDGINGGSNAANPNIVAGSVTVNAATNIGNASDHLWVNAPVISGNATDGGVWINDAATTPVTVTTVTAGNGPVAIASQGNLLVDAINAGTAGATLSSLAGAVLDGIGGGSNAANPNVVAGSVTVNAATSAGSASDALWVNAPVIGGNATNGGVWINDAATTPVTVNSLTAGSGPVVLTTQGDLLVDRVNAGSGNASLSSANGAVLDGIDGGSNAANPNVVAGSVTVNAATNAGNSGDHLWVNSPVISGNATNGGVWINDAATTPVTVASVTAGNGPVAIASQGNLLVDRVNAGTAGATLSSGDGAVLDGIDGGSNAANPNVVAGSVTVNAATNAGSASDHLWVNAPLISGNATDGGVWINDAATTPVTVASVTAGNGAVAIASQGDLLVDRVNAGTAGATLSSADGAVLDGINGGSNAANPNVVAGSVTVNAATNAGSASDHLWVNAPLISGNANGGGVWINDAATTPVTVTSATAGNGPVAIASQGNLLVDTVNAGSAGATLSSAAGAVLDAIEGGSNAGHPNVVAGNVTVNAKTNIGSASDHLWVNAAVISGSATDGGVWINDSATTPVTVTSMTANNGPVAIASQGNLLVDTIHAGSASLSSADGSVLDGIEGHSNAGHPNIVASSVTVSAAKAAGDPNDALWVNAAVIAASASSGVWINDAATTPVMLTAATHDAPIVVGTQGNLLLDHVDAGTGDVTLQSATGSILDGISGGSSPSNPNVSAGAVTLDAADTIGSLGDRVYINAASITTTLPAADQFINTPPTPYPWLPLVAGVAPGTVYAAYAHAQVQPAQDLPITLIGQPLRMAPPIAVAADLLGIALPAGVDAAARQQDDSLDTASKPIFGGNDAELGRDKTHVKTKKQGPRQTKRTAIKPTSKEG